MPLYGAGRAALGLQRGIEAREDRGMRRESHELAKQRAAGIERRAESAERRAQAQEGRAASAEARAAESYDYEKSLRKEIEELRKLEIQSKRRKGRKEDVEMKSQQFERDRDKALSAFIQFGDPSRLNDLYANQWPEDEKYSIEQAGPGQYRIRGPKGEGAIFTQDALAERVWMATQPSEYYKAKLKAQTTKAGQPPADWRMVELIAKHLTGGDYDRAFQLQKMSKFNVVETLLKDFQSAKEARGKQYPYKDSPGRPTDEELWEASKDRVKRAVEEFGYSSEKEGGGEPPPKQANPSWFEQQPTGAATGIQPHQPGAITLGPGMPPPQAPDSRPGGMNDPANVLDWLNQQ